MKTLNIGFCHPVKGVVKLFNKLSPKQHKLLVLDTRKDTFADIPVDGLPSGQWKAIIEWEYDGMPYCYEKDFEVE